MRALANVSLALVVAFLACEAAMAAGALAREETSAVSRPATKSADRLTVNQPQGVYVQGVEPGSPANKAGIEAGDIIVAVDRKPVVSPSALFKAIHDHKSETPILLQIRRGDSVWFAMLSPISED